MPPEEGAIRPEVKIGKGRAGRIGGGRRAGLASHEAQA